MTTAKNHKKPEHVLKATDKPRIVIGTATCGRAAGAMKVLKAIKEELKKQKIDADITEVGCIGLCFAEPLVEIVKPNHPRIIYGNITPEKAIGLIDDYLINDNPRPDLALCTIGDDVIPCLRRLVRV